MIIAMSGATGLIGHTLKEFLLKKGHQVNEISNRHKWFNNSLQIFWDLKKNYVDAEALEGHDAIIHLAGANISARSWSASYKKEILDSRVKSTTLLVKAIQKMNRRPKIFFSASAVGYYGSHDSNDFVNERSPAGQGFLADVCHQWEDITTDLVLSGVRPVNMRFGVVLSKKGGALAKMLPPFYFCLGGKLGSGRQKMSWIALDEIPRIVDYIITHDDISGPVNFVSPNPVTNWEFTKTLGAVIHRPTIFPVPGFMIKLMFGEMGKTLLLEGAHVIPDVLLAQGYRYTYPDLAEALKAA